MDSERWYSTLWCTLAHPNDIITHNTKTTIDPSPGLAWPGLTTQRASEWAWVCGVRARECSMWPRIRSKLDVRRSVGGGNKGNERQREAAGKAKLSLVRNYVSIKRRSCFYLCPLKQQHLVVLLYRDRLKSVHQVWWILFLLLPITSAPAGLQHSRNLKHQL